MLNEDKWPLNLLNIFNSILRVFLSTKAFNTFVGFTVSKMSLWMFIVYSGFLLKHIKVSAGKQVTVNFWVSLQKRGGQKILLNPPFSQKWGVVDPLTPQDPRLVKWVTDSKVESSHAKIYENFANYFLNSKAKNKKRAFKF